LPAGLSGTWESSAYALPITLFDLVTVQGPPPVQVPVQIITNPNGLESTIEGVYGYADCSPTMPCGNVPPEQFYTVPDDQFVVGIAPGSGGGDAIDISWAVDEVTGQPAGLASIDFVRITTSVYMVSSGLGELSTEVGGVARVLVARSDWDGDGAI